MTTAVGPIMGVQTPRIMLVPDYVSSAGAEAIDLCEMAGLHLDPWQQLVLTHSLGERADGKWAAAEVGVDVARQNGKGGIIEARELTGLYLLGELLIAHTAHQFDTSLEAFRRLLMLIENTPELSRRVKRVVRSHGEEGIELIGGQRIRFRTRTKGGGRGFTGDLLLYDEAMILPETAIGATMPSLSARPNTQTWYLGSAVDQEIHDHGIVFARVRQRGRAGTDPSLAYFEWSADPGENEDGEERRAGQVDEDLVVDPDAWAQANPSLGIRISVESIEREQRAMDPRTFAVERLGIGDWPDTDPAAGSLISPAAWKALADPESAIEGPVCVNWDVAPDRSLSSICVGGLREDGLVHVELIDRLPGTSWVPARLAELQERHELVATLVAASSPAASLIDDVEAEGVEVTEVSTEDFVKACGSFYDMVRDQGLRHLGGRELLAAIRGAATRPLVDAWAWSRRASKIDVTPLVGVTLTAWYAAGEMGDAGADFGDDEVDEGEDPYADLDGQAEGE